MIKLKYASIQRIDGGMTEIVFLDGRSSVSWPHPEQPHYHAVAHRCGYDGDLAQYCFEHDFVHLFLCEKLYDRECPILRAQAEDCEVRGPEAAFEELAVQSFQMFMRGNQRPFVADVPWDELRAEALRLLAQS